jgi:hypothetical protein
MYLQIFNSITLFKSLHIIISGAFVLIAIWLIIRSVRGMVHNHPYTLFDKYLSYAFIVLLYFQLIFGLIIFAAPVSADNYSTGSEGALRLVSKRFWPIEHIVLMLFALFIANIGLIFSYQTADSREKHRKVLIYCSIAVAMITLSLIAVNLP